MSHGVRNIYRKMEIEEKNILNIYAGRETDAYVNDSFFNEMCEKIDEYHLDTYNGEEYILLPMASHMELDFVRENDSHYPLNLFRYLLEFIM